MVEVIPLVGLILSAVALFVDIAFSFSPVWWYYRKIDSGSTTKKYNAGLWRYCEKEESVLDKTEECKDHTDDNYMFNKIFVGASQVFQCLAFLLLVATIVFIVLKMFVLRDKSFLMPLAIAHALWAGLCLVGSAAAFGRGITNSNEFLGEPHFSLAFAVISGILALAAGVVLLLNVDVIKNKLPIKSDKINHSEK